MINYLWKHKQVESSFAFIPENSLPPLGFCSLYGVSETDAKALMEAGSYAGFKGVVYPGEWLWIDVDDDNLQDEYERKIDEMGLEFQLWTTGNRGCHFAIRRNLSPSQHAPNVDKEWVKQHFPDADLGLYSHLHLIRQKGAIHEKTGLRKTLLRHLPGSVLFLEYSAGAKKTKHVNSGIVSSVFDNKLIMDLSIPHESGSRRKYLLRLAAELARTNNPMEFALVWMINVNMMGDPLPEDDLANIVKWAYSEASK